MIIDVHAHYVAPAALEYIAAQGLAFSLTGTHYILPPKLTRLDERLSDMDASGVDVQVLSATPPGCDLDGASPAQSVEIARRLNDGIAAAMRAHPGRLRGFAILPLQDVPAALREYERARGSLGLDGVILLSNVAGRPLDDPSFAPLFAAAEADATPLFLHPTRPLSTAGLTDYGLVTVLGFLFDTTLTVARLIYGGVLARHPRLILIVAHLGSTLPYIKERLDIEYTLKRAHDATYAPPIAELPSTYLKGLYVDTVSYDRQAYLLAHQFFGAQRIVLGSDYPYSRWPDAVRAVKDLPLARDDLRCICGGNAEALLRRPAPRPAETVAAPM